MPAKARLSKLTTQVHPGGCCRGDAGDCGSCNTPRRLHARQSAWPQDVPLPAQPALQSRPVSASPGYDWRAVHADLESGVFA
eukprot:4102114-Amphidinium_carterae.1